MTNLNNKMILIMFLLVALVTFGGCSVEEPLPKVSLAVIAGVHSNSYQIPFSSETIYENLYRTSYTSGKVTFINCDGSPNVYFQTNIPEHEVSGLSDSKMKSIAKEQTSRLLAILAEATANEIEVNTLRAIIKGAKALESSDMASERILLVLDSGLSTTGYLNFTNGILNATPNDIVNALIKVDSIPDVRGINIIWAYIGDTAPPQDELSLKEKQALKDIWEAILLAGGAESITFKNDFPTSNVNEGLPFVSTVDVEDEVIDVQIKPKETAKINYSIESVTLDGTCVKFIGDSDQFVDPIAAAEAVLGIASQLISHPDNKVYVIGTTASGDDKFTIELSTARANAVKNLLENLGVNEEQMIAIGLGNEDPWHIYDLDDNRMLIESIAAQNRKVMIVDVKSQDAEFLNKLRRGR